MRSLKAIVVGVTIFEAALIACQAAAQDRFQKLSGPQIRTKLSGMEMSDEVHFGDIFGVDGTLTSYSMGRKKVDKWSVQKDEVCLDRSNKDDSGCYQVWLAGNKIELRRSGASFALDGILRTPVKRN